MKTQAIALAIALIIAIPALTVPLLLFPNHQLQPSPQNYSPDGLVTSLSLNLNSIKQGQTISITISIINPTDHYILVKAADDWPIKGSSVGPCGTMNEPIGMAIFSGYYSAANITEGKPLILYHPGIYFCPDFLINIKGYIFLPYGSNDTHTPPPWAYENGTFYLGAYYISNSFQFSGFWTHSFEKNGSNLETQIQFHSFPPGVYTVAFTDEWGQLKLAYFNVMYNTSS